MIEIKNLKKSYKTESMETMALNNISLKVEAGEFVAVMGPSGCGKSTLLNILGLLDQPESGNYLLNGTDVSAFNEDKCCEIRMQNIGFVFQSFNLIEELNVYENIELPLVYSGIKSSRRKELIMNAMERVNITHRRRHFPSQLSGGQQQRVAVARAIVNNPKLILADEPTGNLDSRNSTEVMELLSELNETGSTVIMVTHSEHDARYSRRTVHMLDGDVVTDNFLRELSYTARLY